MLSLISTAPWISAPSITIARRTVLPYTLARSPRAAPGPIRAAPSMRTPSPTTVGPSTRASGPMNEPFSKRTLPMISAPGATSPLRPNHSGGRVSRTRALASNRSSGLPVSFHHPLTRSTATFPPASCSFQIASVISSSPRRDGFNCPIIEWTLGANR